MSDASVRWQGNRNRNRNPTQGGQSEPYDVEWTGGGDVVERASKQQAGKKQATMMMSWMDPVGGVSLSVLLWLCPGSTSRRPATFWRGTAPASGGSAAVMPFLPFRFFRN